MQSNISLTSIILFVRDVERLMDFYTGHFRLELIEHDQQMWALLKAGSATIGLHRMGEEYLIQTDDSFKANNNVKLVFEILEDIHQMRARLLEQRITMREVKIFPGYDYWLCDGEDPEGNVFQLKQAK